MSKITEEITNIPLWKQVVFLILVFLLVAIIAAFFPPEWRKKILKYFLRYSLFVLALLYLVKNMRMLLPGLNLEKLGASGGNVTINAESTPAVFTPPQFSSTLLYMISLAVILVLAGAAVLLSRRWLHTLRLQKNSQPLEGLAEIARSSRAAISSGMDWKDEIIRCYARMSDVAGSHRGLLRRKDFTASEFASRLEEAGLPGEAVWRLTGLFESARYGVRLSSIEEKKDALACLTAILNACGVSE